MNADALARRLSDVLARVDDAARTAGRDPRELTTVVVTKSHPVELIRRLAELGVRDVGENRHQEAKAKADALASLGLRWHFVGQLQTKKARQVRAYADVVHSVDRVKLVDALAARDDDGAPESHTLDCFVQVDLSGDPGRGGAAPQDLEHVAERVLEARGLRLLGVMAVAPLGEEPARAFERLSMLSRRVVALEPTATAISAGMSQDFDAAVAQGATHLRIGTAITGNRPRHG